MTEIEAWESTDANQGFCIACGSEAYGVEPDACRYACDACGQRKVFGIEELFLMGIAQMENSR